MELLSGAHLAALVLTGLAAAGLVAAARRGPELGAAARPWLAATILVAYVAEHAVYAARGQWSAEVNLPLHLTDAVTLMAVAALWFPQQRLLVELLYFWALSASLQAVLTPDLGRSFPDPLFLTFFLTHSGAVLAACLLVFGCRRMPRSGAVPRVFAITAGFAAVAGTGALVTGGNYMYLRHKPPGGSLLDLLGPWPWYIVAAALVALLIFVVLDRLARLVERASQSAARS